MTGNDESKRTAAGNDGKMGRQPEEGLLWLKRSDRGRAMMLKRSDCGRAMTQIQRICVISHPVARGEVEVVMQQPVRADNKRQWQDDRQRHRQTGGGSMTRCNATTSQDR